MHFFVHQESEGQMSPVNYQSDQLEKRYRDGTFLLFLGYVSEASVYLDVNKGNSLRMCCGWLRVRCVCAPCKWEKKICIYWTKKGGITWESKTTKFVFL